MRNQSESKKPNHRKLLEMACRHAQSVQCVEELVGEHNKSPDSGEIAFEKVKKSVEKKGF